MNTKTEKPEFFWHKKPKKSIWKRAKTAKPQNRKSQYPLLIG